MAENRKQGRSEGVVFQRNISLAYSRVENDVEHYSFSIGESKCGKNNKEWNWQPKKKSKYYVFSYNNKEPV